MEKDKMARAKKRIPVIVCGGKEGQACIYGYVDALPIPEQSVTIYDARMILSWHQDCGGLLGLAANGPKSITRITSAVPSTGCICRQFVQVSETGAEAINAWPNA
jgi:hypothetical protein